MRLCIKWTFSRMDFLFFFFTMYKFQEQNVKGLSFWGFHLKICLPDINQDRFTLLIIVFCISPGKILPASFTFYRNGFFIQISFKHLIGFWHKDVLLGLLKKNKKNKEKIQDYNDELSINKSFKRFFIWKPKKNGKTL